MRRDVLTLIEIDTEESSMIIIPLIAWLGKWFKNRKNKDGSAPQSDYSDR